MNNDSLITILTTIAYVVLINRREQFFYIIFFISFGLNYNKIIELFKAKSIIRVLTRLVIIYPLAYFLIKDPNPFYHLVFFFLPFQNYFRGIFILVFLSYFLSLKEEGKELKYFLSSFFSHITIKRIILIILGLSLISCIIYIYDQKLFIFFTKKDTAIKQYKYYIVANLYNVENILPDWTNEMKKLINYIGPKNVYFSVFENGDSTDNTASMLLEFGKYLTSIKVPNKIGVEKQVNKKSYERIVFLALIRNKAMEFLYEIPNLDFNNTKIIFFNDIIFSYENIIKLLMTNDHHYDVVCPMDFYESFYDTWASMGIDAKYPRYYYPYFINKVAQDRYINGEPIRSFSCWNGVSVMTSKPFESRAIKFRSGVALRQSECLLVIRDMYKMGYKRVMINTEVKVAYEYYYYYMNKYVYPWTKNLFTYFYYYFKFFREKNLKSLGNMKDADIELSPHLPELIEKYFGTKPIKY